MQNIFEKSHKKWNSFGLNEFIIVCKSYLYKIDIQGFMELYDFSQVALVWVVQAAQCK